MPRNFIARATARMEQSEQEAAKKSPRAAARVFDDTDVCRLLGLRRRVLVAARTQSSRGVDWDCVGQHAGMTESWIRGRGADPSSLSPIEPGDGIVTVRAASRVANINIMVCFKLSSGDRAVVMVKDSRMIRLGDQFDCRNTGTKLYLDQSLNPENY